MSEVIVYWSNGIWKHISVYHDVISTICENKGPLKKKTNKKTEIYMLMSPDLYFIFVVLSYFLSSSGIFGYLNVSVLLTEHHLVQLLTITKNDYWMSIDALRINFLLWHRWQFIHKFNYLGFQSFGFELLDEGYHRRILWTKFDNYVFIKNKSHLFLFLKIFRLYKAPVLSIWRKQHFCQ